jgi:HEAT repeat protein
MIRWIPFLVCLAVLIGVGPTVPAAQEQPAPTFDGKTIRQLKESLKSREAKDREAAAEALKWIGPPASDATPALIEALRDKEWGVRVLAAQALGRVSPKDQDAIRALREALKDEREEVRSVAVAALGKSGLEAVVPALTGALEDREWSVRWAAVRALANVGPEAKGVVRALTEALKDRAGGIAGVRSTAAVALRKFGPKAEEAVPALVKGLKAEDETGQFRMDAAEALWRIDKHPAAIPALAETLRNKRLSDRILAASALGRIGSPAVPALIKAVEDTDAYVRRAAAAALENVGPIGRPAIPALTRALDDESAFVRVHAARALWRLDQHPAAVPALAEALKAPGRKDPGSGEMELWTARQAAVDALHKMGREVREAVPALARALGDKGWKERWEAAWVLEDIGPDAKAAIPALTAALEDEDSQVRMVAADALGALGPDAKTAVPALTELLKDKEHRVWESSARALWRIDKDPAVVRPFIEQLGKGPNDWDRLAAARVLGEIGPEPGVILALVEALKDKDWAVRSRAAESLGAIRPREKTVVTALLNVLEDPSDHARFSAAKALWQIEKHPRAIPALAQLLDGDPELGRQAVSLLAHIGPGAKAARAILIDMLASKSDARVRAAEALWWIEKHPRAIPTIIEVLNNKNWYYSVRCEACISLSKIGPPAREAVPALVTALTDQEESVVRTFVPTALGGIGPAAQAAVPSLLDALEDEDLSLRSGAAEALKKIDPQAAAKAGIR